MHRNSVRRVNELRRDGGEGRLLSIIITLELSITLSRATKVRVFASPSSVSENDERCAVNESPANLIKSDVTPRWDNSRGVTRKSTGERERAFEDRKRSWAAAHVVTVAVRSILRERTLRTDASISPRFRDIARAHTARYTHACIPAGSRAFYVPTAEMQRASTRLQIHSPPLPSRCFLSKQLYARQYRMC